MHSNAVTSAHINSSVTGLNWNAPLQGVGLLYFLAKLGIKSAAATFSDKISVGDVLVDSLNMEAYIIGPNRELLRLTGNGNAP